MGDESWRIEAERLRAERDALLAACKAILPFLVRAADFYGPESMLAEYLAQHRAAIARAGGREG
jgi:hypothetical protein